MKIVFCFHSKKISVERTCFNLFKCTDLRPINTCNLDAGIRSLGHMKSDLICFSLLQYEKIGSEWEHQNNRTKFFFNIFYILLVKIGNSGREV